MGQDAYSGACIHSCQFQLWISELIGTIVLIPFEAINKLFRTWSDRMELVAPDQERGMKCSGIVELMVVPR